VTATVRGELNVSLTRDEQGHREYEVDWDVETTDANNDGPYTILAAVDTNCPIGTTWNFGSDNDAWAFATPNVKISPIQSSPGEPTTKWVASQKFSTKPIKRCQTDPIEDPLMEPYKISGGFNSITREATKDKDGNALVYPNFERIKGALVEDDLGYPTIRIELNLATLPLSTYTLMIKRVNDSTLWGLPPRTIRLYDVTWSRNLYGICYYYYTVAYSFEIDLETFDRDILAEGTMVLAPGGNPNNPLDFIKYKEGQDENATTLIDANGAAITDVANAYYVKPKVKKEANFLLLGIPSSIP